MKASLDWAQFALPQGVPDGYASLDEIMRVTNRVSRAATACFCSKLCADGKAERVEYRKKTGQRAFAYRLIGK